MEPIYHVASAADWAHAQEDGAYRMSTRGRTLEQEGYIHCSTPSQVDPVIDRFYAGAGDLRVLTIDPDAVGAEIRFENLDGGTELFPHIYGPLPVAAVTAVISRHA